MSKEIDALKNLIAAMDAEEKARRKMERESEASRTAQIVFDAAGNIQLLRSHADAIEAWSKAFADLNGARGIAKYLISEADAAQDAARSK